MTCRARLVLLAFVLPCVSRAQVSELAQARRDFEYGNYAQAANATDALLDSGRSLEEADLIDAYRISGLSHFYLGHTERARSRMTSLLTTDPDYVMDPFFVPAGARSFFDALRKESAATLEPIREQRRELKRQAELGRKAREAARLERRVEKRVYWVNFLPVGAGQIQQERFALGLGLGAAQVLGVTANLLSYWRLRALRTPDGYILKGYTNEATAWRIVNWGSLAVAVLSYGFSVLEALARFEPEVVTVVPSTSEIPGGIPPAPATPKPPPRARAPAPKTRGYVSPVLDGAVVGVVLAF